jgi:tetratricopeptide (TPR) repeat protein
VCWERAAALDKTFAIPHRNLGMAYYNIGKDPARAKTAFQQAFSANPQDGRLLHELDQLDRLTGKVPTERLARLDAYDSLVHGRDDLYIERIVLCNLLGQFDRSIDLFSRHTFRPWEGGEGKVTEQYIQAHLLRGWQKLTAADAAGALADFEATLTFPSNLGEGRHAIWLSEANLFYHVGRAHQAMGHTDEAAHWYQRCITENKGNPAMHFYQGLALRHSGDESGAKARFEILLTAGRQRLESSAENEKFPTSIPSVMVLKVDQALLTRIEGLYLLGLGHWGLGQGKEAREQFDAVLKLDGNHLGARTRLNRVDTSTEE